LAQTKTNAISWNPMEPMNFTAVRKQTEVSSIYSTVFTLAISPCILYSFLGKQITWLVGFLALSLF